MASLLEGGHDQGQQILGHLGISLVCGVDAIGLHSAGDPIHVLQQNGSIGT